MNETRHAYKMDDKARQIRLKQLEADPIQVGDKVKYRGLVGLVIDEWGVFYACRECTKLLPDKDSKCCIETKGKDKGKPIKARVISGERIFEVEFEDGDRALSYWWLEKL